MVWLALVLLLVSFRRGWVLAPMVLFALPFAMPLIEASLQQRGIDLGLMVPAPLEGFAVEMVSVAGLSVLALHRRRFSDPAARSRADPPNREVAAEGSTQRHRAGNTGARHQAPRFVHSRWWAGAHREGDAMNLLAVEILLAAYALKRGWRVAPFLLVALPLAVQAGAATLVGHLEPWLGVYFDPAATTDALAHGLALLGLVVACWASPSEVPISALFPRPSPRRSGPLYQI